MKKCASFLFSFLIAFSSLYLAGCGNDDDGAVQLGGGTAAQVSTFSAGPVTAVEDGIFVNGTRFNADNADVMINGNSGNVDDIRPGQMVIVDGRSGGGTGTANRIFYQNILTGPISSMEGTITGDILTAGTLTVVVFGQNISIDPNTFIHPALSSTGTGTTDGLASLNTGSVIEVSGMPLEDGSILATAVITNPTSTIWNVHGIVSESTGTAGRTFTLLPAPNGTPLSVELADEAELPAGFEDGLLVNVTVDPETVADPASTEIVAQSVTPDILIVPKQNDLVFLDGRVSRADTAANTFRMGDMTVNAGDQALPQDGSRMAVRGNFENGAVNANQIQTSGSCNFTAGPITSVEEGTGGAGSSFRVNGTPFTTGTGTTGGTNFLFNGRPATADDLRTGMQAVVRSGFDNTFGAGSAGESNTGTRGRATMVFIIENLTGPITAMSGTLGAPATGPGGSQSETASTATFTVLGQTIHVNTETVFEPPLPENGTDPLASFATGSVISVSGVSDGMGNIIATFVESKPDAAEYHLLGVVSNVSGGTFDLNNGTMRVIAGPGSMDETVEDGDVVDVKIDPAAYEPGDTEVVATDVELVQMPFPADCDNVNMNGFVADPSGSSFGMGGLNGMNVDGSGLEPGSMNGMAGGSTANVRGNFSNGRLNATQVRMM